MQRFPRQPFSTEPQGGGDEGPSRDRPLWGIESSKSASDYRTSQNPLTLWRAYALFRAAGGPLPEFILEELDRVAERLMQVSTELPEGEWQRQTLRAFGFSAGTSKGGPVDPYKQLARWNEARAVASRMCELIMGDGLNETNAKMTVAKETRLSESTVLRHWQEHRESATNVYKATMMEAEGQL